MERTKSDDGTLFPRVVANVSLDCKTSCGPSSCMLGVILLIAELKKLDGVVDESEGSNKLNERLGEARRSAVPALFGKAGSVTALAEIRLSDASPLAKASDVGGKGFANAANKHAVRRTRIIITSLIIDRFFG